MTFEEQFPSYTKGNTTQGHIHNKNCALYGCDKSDMIEFCLDKQKVKEFLQSRVQDESGMVVFDYNEIQELGL